MRDDEIAAFGNWKTNAEMFLDVAKLGYLPEPVLDITFNKGKFWSIYRPGLFVTNDLDEKWDTDYHEDFRATKFGEGEFASVVFDPRYKLSGTNKLEKFDRQYGTTESLSRIAIHAAIVGGIAEATRIAKEFVLVKCQDQVNGGMVRWQTALAFDVARAMELTQVGEFWLSGGGLPQDEERGQQHERHDHSTLMIFGTKGANNRRKKRLKEMAQQKGATDQ